MIAGAMAASALLLGAAPAEGLAGKRPKCKQDDGVVTVESRWWQPTIARRGDAIVLTYGNHRVARCKPAATIYNTDTIAMSDESTIDFRGGPFAPGASPEVDGSPEIEFEIGPSIAYPVDLLLGNGDDHVMAGVVANRAIGFNVNPSEADTDADVLLMPESPRDLKTANAMVRAGGGNDVIDASGGPGFAPRTKFTVGTIDGGAGRDTLIGTAGYDFIAGGGGNDVIEGGRKSDLIETRDRSKDLVDCGSGRDTLLRDRRDRANACERNLLPGQGTLIPEPPDLSPRRHP